MKFIQVPHFAVYSYRKSGYMGCIKNEKQRQYSMAQLTEIVRRKISYRLGIFRVQTIRLNEQAVDAKDVQR